MPTYCEKCPDCGHKQEHVCMMKDCDRRVKCDKCGEWTQRDYSAEQPNVGNKEYSRPIVSDSLAIMPNQRTEHEKRWPHVKLDEENRPIFTNYKDHNNYLKDCGFVKQRQRIKQRGKNLPKQQQTVV